MQIDCEYKIYGHVHIESVMNKGQMWVRPVELFSQNVVLHQH